MFAKFLLNGDCRKTFEAFQKLWYAKFCERAATFKLIWKNGSECKPVFLETFLPSHCLYGKR